MAETSLYNQSDIQRYLQKQMTPAEMHAFEKAMMDDPFLADALDGYNNANFSTSQQHLSQIEKTITGNHQQARVIPFFKNKTSWWQVAALVLILAGAGVLTYQLNNTDSDYTTTQQVAQAKEQEASTLNDTVAAAAIPGAIAGNTALPGRAPDNNQPSAPMLQNESLIAEQSDAANSDTALIVMGELNAPSAPLAMRSEAKSLEDVSTDKKMADAASPATTRFTGKVIDRTGEPLPFASVRVQDSNIGAVTDAQGYFSLKASDSVLNVTVQSPGYATANAQLKGNVAPNKITVEEEKATLSEIVVTGMAARKRSASQKEKSAAEPVDGWNKFNKYIGRYKDSVDFSGSITVEFNIDGNGKPVNIVFPNNPGTGVATKIVSILQNGPTWRTARPAEKTKINLTF